MQRDETEPAACADAGASPRGPLVERDAAMHALEQAGQAARTRGGRMVLVCGEAGIGKTRLVEDFLARLPDPAAAACGWCDPMHTPRPLGPVRDLARRLLGPEPGEPDEVRHFDGLLARLGRRPRGGNGVHVLVIEDLHWIDQRSADWLQFIGRRMATLPLLIVGTCRDDLGDAAHPLHAALRALPAARVDRVALQPLTPEGIRRLGRDVGDGAQAAGGPLDADRAEQLHRLTAGNPYFVQELLRHAPWPPVSGDVPLPRTVADALHAGIDALPPPLRGLAELLACHPAAAPVALLRRVATAEEAARIDEAAGTRLLQATPQRIQFRHELARLAVLERLPAPRRRALHRRWLDALRARPGDAQVLDLVVHHARGAGADDVLLDCAPRAAAQAAAFGAHREAAQHLSAAMEAAGGAPPEVAAEVLERWAYEASLADGIGEPMLAARREAVRLWGAAGRADKVGDNLAALARMHRYRGEAVQAQACIEQAIECLSALAPSAAQARAFALRAHFCMLQDRMGEAVEWGGRALRVAGEVGDAATRAHALNTVGAARLLRGDAGGEAALRESLALALRHGQHEQAARAYTNLAEGLIGLRSLDRAEAVIAEGLAFDAAHDFGRWIDYLVGRQAQLRFEQERYVDALAIADGVLAQPQALPVMRMPALIVRACARLRLGDPGAAAAMDEALAEAERIHEPQYLVVLRIAQIEAAVLAGAPAAARAPAAWLAALDAQAIGPRRRGEWAFWQRLAGIADVAAPGGEMPPAFLQLQQGDADAAAAALDAEGSTYLACWARLAASRSPAAMRRADAGFARLHAQAARAALRRDRAYPSPDAGPRGPYAAARGHAYGLTAREQQVLRLVVEGCDNAAIADRLQRSRRTVENHVSAILSKVQARNRLELVLRAQHEPWIVGAA